MEIVFGTKIDDLDTQAVVNSDELFEKMCRVIALTERRGCKQVEVLLNHSLVKSDPVLMRIFRVIKKDEPSHWAPYEGWLCDHGKREPKWWERRIDTFIHSELLFFKLPFLFLNPFIARRKDWADSDETALPASAGLVTG